MQEVRKLTDEERKELRDMAMEWFAEDTRQDPSYAVETVAFLADDQPDQWWVEFLSSDPEVVRQFLSFDPFEDYE